MKWPNSVTLIRHDTSAYNVLRDKKKDDPLYKRYLAARKRDDNSEEARDLARQVQKQFSLGVSDADTPLADVEGRQGFEVGTALASFHEQPDAIFVSPYKRALMTLEHITRGWPDLKSVKVYKDDRVREQEHGLALLYNDWKVFETLHPEQRELRKLEGSYWYRYPQGENVPDVRERNRSWLTTLTRDFAGKRVLVVTHHLNILAVRANLERFDATEFIRLDEKDKPINCGVTLYLGKPDKGKDGKLELEFYNKRYYR
ncbi:MAG: Phosphoglycerate/bisphosphoglycerate mutase [Parcubacteria group bacterium GW2011_GWA2_47_16]|nr:MAG: Phosphoglycerate/bisphosphoglycerate mutase [Parcubacteria group bacterium GW2011_GWA2_47_16]